LPMNEKYNTKQSIQHAIKTLPSVVDEG